MSRDRNIFLRIDWLLVVLYLVLAVLGILSIYSVEAGREGFSFSFSQGYVKQMIWVAIGVLAGFLVLLIDKRFFQATSYPIYILILLLIVGAGIWGVAVGGTKGWIDLGFFRLQPSEFGKLATALALAKFLTTYGVRVEKPKHLIGAFALIFIPVGFILTQQSDVGTSVIYFALGLVLYRQGMHSFFIFFPLWAGVLFLLTLLFDEIMVVFALVSIAVIAIAITRLQRKWFLGIAGTLIVSALFVFGVNYAFEEILQEHHKQRINVLIGQEIDMRGPGYNVHQSLIAVGSGGMTGQGFLNGTQTQYDFIPEQNTDFIFCAIAEERGFLGSAFLLLIYLVLLLRIVFLSESVKDRFTRVFGYGLASILFLHFTINIAMTIGLFPVVGIPLPFVSYGGSSFLSFSLMLFIFLTMEAQSREVEY